ncbi:MORC family CW-type zinc finger protein 3 isoform X1 [Ictalurus punctatus]|uniref:MORC family CW-type zinc finger protein 3 isoform X1 n=1 Tax=Ictalurus punctatus TaxID=7998 RepID=A0A2D0SDV9_ICTPU|nr:MORC family CW-type zinc finger protein 3 isoform X1 [Ictalurus punctatus]
MARLSEHGIRLSSMSPSYLDSNSTSHTWPFSAVAELIDNASDPGVTAKQIWIDAVTVKEELCLSFIDNGSGMTPSKLHKMLSFGFTEKGSGKGSHQAIGIYGNGFKSGSMRLGRDALIFTKNGGCQSVGMLSQTFLHAIKAQAVIVPIAPFNQQTKSLVITEDSEASLRAILTHSLFKSESELQEQLDSIPGKKGTKILIWNIRRNKDGKPELDFEVDEEDIRLPEIRSEEMEGKGKRRYFGPHRTDHIVPEMDYSLRAYLSILYLKPRIQIILRQKKVQTKLVAKSLSMIENDVYKPQFINERVKITFGFNHKNKDHYGIMMYHNNRLIKSYEKVGCQIKSSGLRSGVGVIGVIECNFLKPAHNKQDFEYTKEYRLTLAALGIKLNDYWREKKEKKAKERAFRALERKSIEGTTEENDESEEEEEEEEEEEKEEEEIVDVSWIQCEDCMKWRGIPTHLFKNNIPEHFTCSQHPIGRLRSCLVPEEPEEPEDELTPSYEKTHKKQDVWGKRRGKSVDSDKGPALHDCKEASEPTSETTPDETVITIEAETESKADESTPSSHSHRNKRKATWTNNEIDSKSPKRTDSEKEISTTATESEEQVMEKTLEVLETNSNKDQTMSNATEEGKSPAVSPDTESAANPSPSEQQVAQGPQTKDQPKLTISPPGWPHPIAPHPSMAWSHPLPPAQTVVVPPLSRTSRQSRPLLRLESPDRSVLTSRLDQLEREAKRLRRILGLREAVVQMNPLSDGEVSGSAGAAQDGSTDSGVETVATASFSSKKSGSQPDQQILLKRNVSPAGQQEAPVTPADDLHWSKTLAKLQSQNQALCTELSKVKKENDELQSKARQAERETRDRREQSTNTPSNIYDSIALDRLRSIRRNVVSLLSSILPNLDMQGISYDTGDVDSILQQIIQANNL